jgi:alpha-L-rhamnosidase
MMLELDEKLSLGFDRALYTERRQKHIDAIMANFFDPETGDFEGGRFGANAFAVNIGLGDERTFDNMVKKYDEFGGLDTGIFATELLIKTLGERGRADLVYKLLTSHKFNSSFYSMFKNGATTLWEDWDGHSSHNHPMFGGCFKAMWTCFLGINPTSAGYKSVRITPCDIEGLGNMYGYMETAFGRLSVNLHREGESVKLVVVVPTGCETVLDFRGREETLHSGVNILEYPKK